VVDERGFVDGVKVARKVSKANVLGKAVEYIRWVHLIITVLSRPFLITHHITMFGPYSVLKKRETRLAREQAGLRALVCGLVGGPALLKEWEHEWKQRFGGSETDEVDGDEMEGDEEEDDDGDDDDEGSARGRKRPKVAKKEKEKPAKKPPPTRPALPPVALAAAPSGVAGAVVPEKRKRGRPRKNPLPAAVAQPQPVVQGVVAPPVEMESSPFVVPSAGHHAAMGQEQQLATMQQAVDVIMKQEEEKPMVQIQGQGSSQYLLAAFAFFSVFNSPLTSYTSSSSSYGVPTHTGSVRTHTPVQGSSHAATSGVLEGGWTWQSLIQVFHLLVSALVLLSILAPWIRIPKRLRGSKAILFLLSPFVIRTSSSSASPSKSPAAACARSGSNATARPRRRSSSSSTSGSSSDSDNDSKVRPRKPRSYRAVELLDALAPTHRGTPDEAPRLRHALGVKEGLLGLLINGVGGASQKERGRGVYELRQLEQRAWVRLGELVAADG
jgi:hypothetical protein